MKRKHGKDHIDNKSSKRSSSEDRTIINMTLPPSMGINNIPYIMTISKVGNDMDVLPIVDTDHTTAPFSMEDSLLALIIKTENTCRHELLADRDPAPADGVLYDVCRNLNSLIFKGNTNFLLQSEELYTRHNHPEELRFRSLLCRSRAEDPYWENFMHMHCVHQLRTPCVYELVDTNDFAVNYYVRRKLDTCTPFTELDAYVVANAYHAELEVYNGPRIGYVNYRFKSSCSYNYQTIDKPRPKWILFKDHRGCWQAITGQITDKMYFNYQSNRHSTVLIEGERVRDAPGAGPPYSDSD